MDCTTKLFTEFNERLSVVCEKFADKVSSSEGPTETEMAEHFKNFRSYIEQTTAPFWQEPKEYLDGKTGEEYILRETVAPNISRDWIWSRRWKHSVSRRRSLMMRRRPIRSFLL